jgi:L-threonylcarbamoyladenylate synthase
MALEMADLQKQIDKGIQILKRGGVIAFPTDTVYGLGADAFNTDAVGRIYDIKKRPIHLPLPLLIGDIKQLDILAEPLSEIALFLAKHFWPGGLTLVLPKAANLPGYLGNTSIAVRVPAHPVCLALIQGINNPIIGTSANVSGEPSALTAGEVKQQLGNEVDLVINGGRCPGGGESTVVDVTGGEVVIVRQGIIPGKEIKRAVEECRKEKNYANCFRL